MNTENTKELTAMNSDRIKEIQETTAFPESLSVKQALLQVWNECEQQANKEIEVLKSQLKAKDKEIENIKLEIISVLKPFIHDSISSDDIERIEKFYYKNI